MTRYDNGRTFEYKIIHDLQSRGFITVRAAGSAGAGKVDIVAVRADGVHLWIQAKGNGKIAPAEWNQLRLCAGWAGATPILASKGPRGTPVVYEELTADKVPYSRTRPAQVYTILACG